MDRCSVEEAGPKSGMQKTKFGKPLLSLACGLCGCRLITFSQDF